MRQPRVIAIVLVLAGAAATGVWLAKPGSDGTGSGLQLGDCFDVPQARGDVASSAHLPCTQPHTGEVILVGRMDAGDAYPDEATFNDFVLERCVPAYAAWTGTDLYAQEGMDLGWSWPSEDDWRAGDRAIVCWATREDGAPFSGSLKQG